MPSPRGRPSLLTGWFHRPSVLAERAGEVATARRPANADAAPPESVLLFLSPSPDERTAFAARLRAISGRAAAVTRSSSESLLPGDAAMAAIVVDCRDNHDAIMRIRGELDLLGPATCPLIVPLVRATKADKAWALAIGADRMLVDPYDDVDLALLLKAADQSADLLRENARLKSSLDDASKDAQGLRTLAYTDHLTGLPNRLYLVTWLGEIIARRDADPHFAVHMLDLDGFKRVNDRHGHRAGDEILRQTATRVTNVCRRLDLVVRLGGDEIVIVQAGVVSDKDCRAFTARLVQTFQAPFVVDDIESSIGVSIGSAIYPADGRTVSELLHHADLAMYAVKPPGMERSSFADGDRLARLAEARLAMDQGSYAPAFLLGSGMLTAVMCVAHEGEEEQGTIAPLLRLACLQSAAHRTSGQPEIVFAAAMDDAVLTRDDLLSGLRDLLTDTGADPARCEIVVAASVLDRDPELWHQVRELGYGLGVLVETENFWPQRLLRVPLTRLHLGPSFLFSPSASSDGRVLLGMAVMFAHAVYAGTLVHGVATAEQVEMLRDAGVTCATGPLAGAPIRGSDLPAVRRQPVHDWTVEAPIGSEPA